MRSPSIPHLNRINAIPSHAERRCRIFSNGDFGERKRDARSCRRCSSTAHDGALHLLVLFCFVFCFFNFNLLLLFLAFLCPSAEELEALGEAHVGGAGVGRHPLAEASKHGAHGSAVGVLRLVLQPRLDLMRPPSVVCVSCRWSCRVVGRVCRYEEYLEVENGGDVDVVRGSDEVPHVVLLNLCRRRADLGHQKVQPGLELSLRKKSLSLRLAPFAHVVGGTSKAYLPAACAHEHDTSAAVGKCAVCRVCGMCGMRGTWWSGW